MEGIERIEKFFLCRDFAADELDVVDHQDVDRAVALAECIWSSLLNSVNEFVCKLLTGNIKHAAIRMVLQSTVADSVHEMRFSKTDAPIDEEWIVDFAGVVGYRHGGGVCKAVRTAGNKGFKRILWVE